MFFITQTFDLLDLPRIGFIALLEILLSADNAIVLGILVRNLPVKQRQKALYIGVASSFLLRGVSLFTASLLLKMAWLQIAGGVYLLYLFLSHVLKKRGDKMHVAIPKPAGFWKTVFLVEAYDLAFAIDSIIVAAAFISTIPHTGTINPKLWIVYLGVFTGLLFIRYAARLFSSLTERFPRMYRIAFWMIGWIGLKLCLGGLDHYGLFAPSVWPLLEKAFWAVLALLFLFGFTKKVKS